jgi:hypothetical protein
MIPNIDISVLKQVLISLKYFELIPIRYDWTNSSIIVIQISSLYIYMTKKWLDILKIKY